MGWSISAKSPFKGSFAHGWMGDIPIQYGALAGSKATSYFHQSSLYGRLGKPNWKIKLYGGINHEVIWGSDRLIFGSEFNLTPRETFLYVVTGRKYLGAQNAISKVGNHLGSIDLGFTYDFKTTILSAYRQQFFDKGAIAYLANVVDGLNGITLTNKKPVHKKLYWHKMLFEILYSKNQAGEENAKWTPSGPENYYNHGVHTEGYSYKGLGLGTPFISTANSVRQGLPSAPGEYFINNRVLAFHAGAEVEIKKWFCTSKISYSRNWGTHATGPVVHWWFNGQLMERHVVNIFKQVGQLSTYFETRKEFKKGWAYGGVVAIDVGDLLYNSAGVIFKVSKTF
jgi:hypothetical protein